MSTLRERSLRRVGYSLFVVLSATALSGQALDPIQQPAVGVRVIRGSLTDERGSGFVISVDNETVYILTARHLFYADTRPFRENIKVTFAVDPLNERPAHWHVDFSYLDLAVIKVSASDLPAAVAKTLSDLPAISVRPSSAALKLKEDIFLVGGKFQDWQLPKDTVTGTQDDIDRLDRFRFTGTGIHDGFSGSAVLDSSDRLVGVHLGAVPSDDNYGRAQRIADAIPILLRNNIPMNKLELNGAPGSTKATSGTADPLRDKAPPATLAGDFRTNAKDGLTSAWIPPGSFQMVARRATSECLTIRSQPSDTGPCQSLTVRRMEIHLAPDTEAQLQHLATSQGKNAAQVVEETLARVLDRRAQFLEGVERGIAAADRGDLIDHAEVVNRIERLFQSRRRFAGRRKPQTSSKPS